MPVPSDGLYAVLISYPSDTRAARNVPVTVTLPGGKTHVFSVDQAVGGGRPFLLGKYEVDGGGDIRVRIANDNTTGSVLVDLAMIALLGHSECVGSSIAFGPATASSDWARTGPLRICHCCPISPGSRPGTGRALLFSCRLSQPASTHPCLAGCSKNQLPATGRLVPACVERPRCPAGTFVVRPRHF